MGPNGVAVTYENSLRGIKVLSPSSRVGARHGPELVLANHRGCQVSISLLANCLALLMKQTKQVFYSQGEEGGRERERGRGR